MNSPMLEIDSTVINLLEGEKKGKWRMNKLERREKRSKK